MPIEQNESKYSSKHRISTKRLAYWNEPVCKPIIIYTTIFCFALLCFLNLCQATEELIEVLPGGSLNQLLKWCQTYEMWRGFVWRWGYSKFQNFQIPSDDGIIFSLFFPTGICHIFALFQVGRGCLGTELSSKNGRRGDGRREQGLEERNINKPPKSNFRFMKFLNTNHQVFVWW